MVKKESLPIRKEDLHADRWINTPWVYTNYGAEFSLLQQDIMLKVSEHLQGYLKAFFDEKRNESTERPKSLFSKYLLENGIPTIRIPLSELNIGKEHYAEIERFEKDEQGKIVSKGGQIEAIRTLGVRVKYKEKETGKERVKLINVFRSVDIPVGEGGIRKEGFIELNINHDVAAIAFDMSDGYTPHIKQIAQYSTKRTAPRIYLFLIREYSLGRMKVKKTLMELKEYLGMVVKDEEDNILEVKYPQWPKFKQRVLDPSKEDVDRMASRNESEITFTYKPIYRGGKVRGNPDFVEFQIERSALGERRDTMTHRTAAESKVIGWVMKQWEGLDGVRLRRLVTSVQPDEVFADFCAFLYHDLRKVIEKKDFDLPEDQAAYLFKVIENWVAEHQGVRILSSQPVQQELFTDPEPEPVKDTLERGGGAALWQQLIKEYDGPAKDTLKEVEYLGLDDGVFCIVADPVQRDIINTMGDGELYRQARLILGMSETSFRPPIVMRKN